MDILKDITLPDGWVIPDEKIKRALENELAVEANPEHVLFGKKCTTLSRSYFDDVIFLVHEDPIRFALVHLTYSAKQDKYPKFPYTLLYDDLKKLINDVVS